jgi:hypothetical protein
MVTLTGHPMQPAGVPRNRSRRIRQGNNHRPSLPHHPAARTFTCTTAHTLPQCSEIKAEHTHLPLRARNWSGVSAGCHQMLIIR